MATAAARPPPQPRPRRRPQEQPRPRAAPKPATRRRASARPRLAGSVVWILVVAGLLAGIGALTVGVHRHNLEAQRLAEQRNELVARRDALSAELSRSAAAGRIEAIALNRLGLVRPDQTTYVRLTRARTSKGE